MTNISAKSARLGLLFHQWAMVRHCSFLRTTPSLLPSAGVAVQLEPKESGIFMPLPVVEDVEGFHPNGTIFCYLPLPIHSGLPVHINGPFAVTSNRRHLQKKLEDDKTCHGVQWNKCSPARFGSFCFFKASLRMSSTLLLAIVHMLTIHCGRELAAYAKIVGLF